MKSTPSQNPSDQTHLAGGVALKDLQPVEPPPDTWAAIVERVDNPSPGRGAHYWRAPVWALAASLVFAAVVVSWWPDSQPPLTESTPVSGDYPELAQLQRRSAQLERLIWPPVAEDPAESALFYRIADVDSQLSGYAYDTAPAMQRALWQQRVSTLQSLAEIRRVRATSEEKLF